MVNEAVTYACEMGLASIYRDHSLFGFDDIASIKLNRLCSVEGFLLIPWWTVIFSWHLQTDFCSWLKSRCWNQHCQPSVPQFVFHTLVVTTSFYVPICCLQLFTWFQMLSILLNLFLIYRDKKRIGQSYSKLLLNGQFPCDQPTSSHRYAFLHWKDNGCGSIKIGV